MNQTNPVRRKGRRSLARLLAVAAIGVPLAACDTDQLLDVSDPAVIPPEGVGTPEAVTSLFYGAIRDFNIAYSGAGDDAFIISSGLMADELYNGDTFTTRIAIDQRNQQAPQFGNVQDVAYSRFHRARFAARRAAYAVKTITPSDNATFARLRAIEAYTYVSLAEGWCGNVPFSTVPDSGAIDPANITYKPGIGTAAMLDSAVSRFNEALAANPNDNVAKIGKARALLNNNQPAAAAAAVAGVPTTFVYQMEHSPNAGSQNNPVYSLINNGRYGVSNLEGALNFAGTGAYRPDSVPVGGVTPTSRPSAEGIAFRGLQDPRVPWVGPLTAFTSSFRKYTDNNNPSFEADIPLASGVEARLIEAEAQLRAGNFSGAGGTLAILNTLRSSAAALLTVLHPQQVQTFQSALPMAPLADPGTADAQRQLFFQERALWLYNTGHRLGDLRRLVRQYGLAQSAVFPSGPFYRGGNYGSNVAFYVRFEEQNNPQYNPAACSVTTA